MSGLWCRSQGLFQGRVKTHPRWYFGHSQNECRKGRGEQLVATDKVAMFRPYPLRVGQKIHIEGGPRGGDWEIVQVGERKVTLRCPISQRRFEWDRFCYFIEEREGVQWPQEK